MSQGARSTRRTQEVRRSEAERRQLEAATELIGEVGPSRVTLAMVGKRAGYSRGLATHCFGTKGALVRRVIAAVGERFVDAVANDSPDVRPAMVASGRFFRREIESALERGITAGTMPASVDPLGLATVIVAMLRGIAFQAMIDDEIDLQACRKKVERLLRDHAFRPDDAAVPIH